MAGVAIEQSPPRPASGGRHARGRELEHVRAAEFVLPWAGPPEEVTVGATWSVMSLPGGDVRMELRGDVDLVSEAPFVDEVDALAGDGSSSAILLDLAAVDFIDSSGVRALVRVRQQHGDRLRLVAVSAPVHRVLDIAGLAESFGLDGTDGGDGAGHGGSAGERSTG